MKGLLKLLFGIGVGVGYGMLFAKKSGKELRDQIEQSKTPLKDILDELKSMDTDARKTLDEWSEKNPEAKKVKEAGKVQVKKAQDMAKGLARDLQAEVLDDAKKVKDTVSKVKSTATKKADKFKNELESDLKKRFQKDD